MKKVALAAVLAVSFGGVAQAKMFDYAYVGGGYTQSPSLTYGGFENDMDFGFNGGAGVGWNQSDDISFAAEVFYTQSEYDGFADQLSALSFMGNAFYTCDTGEFWRPYLGAGAGVAELHFNGKDPFSAPGTGSDWVFAYQAMAGVSFAVDEKHALFVGYRYQASEDGDIKGVSDVEYASHNVTIGFVIGM